MPDYSGAALFGSTAADTLPLKSWLAADLLGFAVLQVGLPLWIYGRIPGVGPANPALSIVCLSPGTNLV